MTPLGNNFEKVKHGELRNICETFSEFQEKCNSENILLNDVLMRLKSYIKSIHPNCLAKKTWIPPYPRLTTGIILGTLDHVLCSPNVDTSVFPKDDLLVVLGFAENLLWTLKRQKQAVADHDFLKFFSLPPFQDLKQTHNLSRDVFSSMIHLSCSVFFDSKLQSFYTICGSLAVKLFLRSSKEQRCQFISSLLCLFENDESGFYVIPDSKKKIKGATLLLFTLLQSVSLGGMKEVRKLSLIFMNTLVSKAFSGGVEEKQDTVLKHLECFVKDIQSLMHEPLFPLAWLLLEIIVRFLMADVNVRDKISFKKFSLRTISSIVSEMEKSKETACSLNEALLDLVKQQTLSANFQNCSLEDTKKIAIAILKKYLTKTASCDPWVTAAVETITVIADEKETVELAVEKPKKKRRKISSGKSKAVLNFDIKKTICYSVAQKVYSSLAKGDFFVKNDSFSSMQIQIFNYFRINILDKMVSVRELSVHAISGLVLHEPGLLQTSGLLQRTKDVSVSVRKKAMLFALEYAKQNPNSSELESILFAALPRVCDDDSSVRDIAVRVFSVTFNLDFIVSNINRIKTYFVVILQKEDLKLLDLKNMAGKLFGYLKMENVDVNILETLLCIAEQRPLYIIPFIKNLCDVIANTSNERMLFKYIKLINYVISHLDEPAALNTQAVLSSILVKTPYYLKSVLLEVVNALMNLAVLMKNWSRIDILFKNCTCNIKKYRDVITQESSTNQVSESDKYNVFKFSLIVGFIIQCDRFQKLNVSDVRSFVGSVLDLHKVNDLSRDFSILVLGSVVVRFVELMLEKSIAELFKQSLLIESSTNEKLQVVNVFMKILNEDIARVRDINSLASKDLKVMEDDYGDKVSHVIQEFLPQLLKIYPSSEEVLRYALSRLILAIFDHGMMPMKLLPVLIAITTEKEDTIRCQAISAVRKINVSFLHMAAMQGLMLSFKLQVILQGQQIRGWIKDSDHQNCLQAFLEPLYSALNLNHRRAFLQSIVSALFSDVEDHKDIKVRMYMADNLVYFPFTYEDLKFVLGQLDVIIHIHTPPLLNFFKKKYNLKEEDEEEEGAVVEADDLFVNYDFDLLLHKTESCALLLSIREFLFENYGMKNVDNFSKLRKKNEVLKLKKSSIFNFEKIRNELTKIKSEKKLAKKGYMMIKRKLQDS